MTTRRPKHLTKKDQLVRLLRAKAGADVTTISKKLGWQNHTVRAALSGLRKAGFGITADKPEGGGAGRYRIIADPAPNPGGQAAEVPADAG